MHRTVRWDELVSAHPGFCEQIAQVDTSDGSVTWRHRMGAGGDATWLGVRYYDSDDGLIAVQFSDGSDKVREKEQIRYAASHDALTGLLKAGAFRECLETRLAAREPLTIFLIDLNGFKAVNDEREVMRGW